MSNEKKMMAETEMMTGRTTNIKKNLHILGINPCNRIAHQQ